MKNKYYKVNSFAPFEKKSNVFYNEIIIKRYNRKVEAEGKIFTKLNKTDPDTLCKRKV